MVVLQTVPCLTLSYPVLSYEYYYDSVDSIALNFNDSSMELGYLDGKFYIYDTANEELLYPFDITIDEFIEL